jgi:TonB family protein
MFTKMKIVVSRKHCVVCPDVVMWKCPATDQATIAMLRHAAQLFIILVSLVGSSAFSRQQIKVSVEHRPVHIIYRIGNARISTDPGDSSMQATMRPDSMPSAINRACPEYSPAAVRAGYEGEVAINLWIDSSGHPKKVAVVSSTFVIFNPATIQAAHQWLFRPPMINGKAEECLATLVFRFVLIDGKPQVLMPQ